MAWLGQLPAWPQGCAQDKVWPLRAGPTPGTCQADGAASTVLPKPPSPRHSSCSLWLTEAFKTSIVTPLLVPLASLWLQQSSAAQDELALCWDNIRRWKRMLYQAMNSKKKKKKSCFQTISKLFKHLPCATLGARQPLPLPHTPQLILCSLSPFLLTQQLFELFPLSQPGTGQGSAPSLTGKEHSTAHPSPTSQPGFCHRKVASRAGVLVFLEMCPEQKRAGCRNGAGCWEGLCPHFLALWPPFRKSDS